MADSMTDYQSRVYDALTDYQSRVYDALTEIYRGWRVTTEDVRLYLTGKSGYTNGKKVGRTLAQLRNLGFVEGEGGKWEPKLQ